MNSSNIQKRSYQQVEDALINEIIDDLWAQMKKGPNDTIDYRQTMEFVNAILYQMGEKELLEERYSAIFRELDVQSVGNLRRRDLRPLIERLTRQEANQAPLS
jgi:Ca2+-binding EF-hand superfamily protein